jgi:hypothetical protein
VMPAGPVIVRKGVADIGARSQIWGAQCRRGRPKRASPQC